MTRHIVVDVETTGLLPARGHRIIEIGAVAVVGDEMRDEFQSLIRTDAAITKAAQKVHGITMDMLMGQPEAKDVIATFKDFIGVSNLVAHNATFDVEFLRREFMRAGMGFVWRSRCTLRMSRKIFPNLPDFKLATVARHLNISVDDTQRHRALNDARLTAQVWIALRKAR